MKLTEIHNLMLCTRKLTEIHNVMLCIRLYYIDCNISSICWLIFILASFFHRSV